MNKEKRFRVWDNVEDVMMYDDDKDMKLSFFDGKCHIQYLEEINQVNDGIVQDVMVWRDLEDFVLMEYTGLNDRTRQKIYEGDILAIPGHGKCVIVWNESICSFQYAYYAIGKGTAVGGRVTNTLYSYDSPMKYEVIGNIYENPK